MFFNYIAKICYRIFHIKLSSHDFLHASSNDSSNFPAKEKELLDKEVKLLELQEMYENRLVQLKVLKLRPVFSSFHLIRAYLSFVCTSDASALDVGRKVFVVKCALESNSKRRANLSVPSGDLSVTKFKKRSLLVENLSTSSALFGGKYCYTLGE